ncbi:uncharacterized protein LOC111002079 isoform X2 [Pieris rapae]|uniref:uncharacterized protein LOC111002079 isoform X2 n=1 Tax=Pieris rapae TaxID=64459 RepID=UPI001E2818B5|nr:uncharacterized protein LOC111002079 isoform X2 [Pieris rapae]
MSPKKKTSTGLISGEQKLTRLRRKCIVKNSSKVCKGGDIVISCKTDIKPVTRGIKRKGTQNKIEAVNNEQAANDSKNTEINSSNNNQTLDKKRRITRKLDIKSSNVARNRKRNAQVKKKEKSDVKSKPLTLKCKVNPKDLKIVKTFVNDYVPDEVPIENETNSEMPTINTTTKCFDALPSDNLKKNPFIKLKKLVIDNSSYIRDKSEKSLENNNNSNTSGQSNCGNNIDLSSDALCQDTSPSGDPSQEMELDPLHFLDHYTSMLHQYTGFSVEKNVDFSKKKLNLNIQTEELKIIKFGGIIRSDASSSSDNVDKESISLQINVKKLNNTPKPNVTEQVPEAVIEGSDYDPENFDNTNDDDDDDTISLFAESISNFETNSIVSYNSKVDKNEPIVDIRDDTGIFKIPKPVVLKQCIQVCEKQKADSTSFGLSDISGKKIEYIKPETKLNNKFTTKTTKSHILSPVLPGSDIPLKLIRSTVFKGFCIFNIVKICKNSICHFPHTTPTQRFVSEKLIELTKKQFQQEFQMVCNQAQLLRLYGLVYINEGIRRKNYRIVVKITLHALISFEHTQEKQMLTEIVERTLLYLNQVDLSKISDLLISEFNPGVYVCDKFLEVIGQTQNFSRFKEVFVKLAILMCQRNRTFNSETVLQIVERLCILPYSSDLAQAVIEILKRTDRVVFCNSLINVFEQKLLKFDNQLHKEYIKLRDSSSNQCTRIDNGDTVWNISDNAIRCSPDTTNKDNLDRHEYVEPDAFQPHRPQFIWGSPAPINQFSRTFRPGTPQIPPFISQRFTSQQNIPPKKNKRPYSDLNM